VTNNTLSDKMVARLRTVVPALWGSALAWILVNATWLPEPLVDFLQEDVVTVLFTSLVILGWYWLWQRLEPRLPAWLTRILMGSNQTPSYSLVPLIIDNDDAAEAGDVPPILGVPAADTEPR
jgi:hypothetical protein